MILVTFISIHFFIICDVLLWRTYETHLALSLKFGCDIRGPRLLDLSLPNRPRARPARRRGLRAHDTRQGRARPHPSLF
jgi:hypothetical protein